MRWLARWFRFESRLHSSCVKFACSVHVWVIPRHSIVRTRGYLSALGWGLILGGPRLSPLNSWDRLQQTPATKMKQVWKMDGWMDACMPGWLDEYFAILWTKAVNITTWMYDFKIIRQPSSRSKAKGL